MICAFNHMQTQPVFLRKPNGIKRIHHIIHISLYEKPRHKSRIFIRKNTMFIKFFNKAFAYQQRTIKSLIDSSTVLQHLNFFIGEKIMKCLRHIQCRRTQNHF